VHYLAIGDVHGCFQALRTLAAAVPFGAEDVVVALGDYVDGGPDSCAVLDWLIAYARRGRLVALRGNHELMMLQARGAKRPSGSGSPAEGIGWVEILEEVP
jgi:serine/threonine protein phosphatase 1